MCSGIFCDRKLSLNLKRKNLQPQKVVEAKTLCDFKKKLVLGAKGIKGYEGKGESGC